MIPSLRTALILIACLVVALVSYLASEFTGGTNKATEAKVQSIMVTTVTDGSTFSGWTDQDRPVQVRILGIDAPAVTHGDEPAECGAEPATEALAKMIELRRVRLVSDPVVGPEDGLGRQIGYVQVDSLDVGLTLLKKGFVGAWHPASEPEPTKFAAYTAAEERAQRNRVGQWRECEKLGR